MVSQRFAGAALAAVGGPLVVAAPARASFHEWKIDEVFSNASGSVQFVEFSLAPPPPDDNEQFIGSLTFESASGHTYTFPSNLPSMPGAGARFLVATPGYAALSGVPAPDYVLPANNFFSTTGDTLTYTIFGIDTLQFGPNQLPTNGTDSLNRAYGSTVITAGPNTPTNFAGQSGSVAVPEPAAATLLLAAAAGPLLRRSRRR